MLAAPSAGWRYGFIIFLRGCSGRGGGRQDSREDTMRGHEPLVPSSSGSPCIPRAELCPSGEGTGPGHPQLGRACSRPAARWVLRTCNHSSHERPVYSPLSSRALEMPSATAIPRDKDNGQQRDTTVIPAHPVVLRATWWLPGWARPAGTPIFCFTY